MGKIQFHKILKKLIDEKGISIRELSREVSIPQTTLQNYLSGKQPQNPEQILLLAKYFGTTMEFLLFGEDDKQPTLDDVMTEGIFEGWLKVKIERAIPNKRKV